MYHNILIPTDGSDGINRVLPHGIDLAQNHNATVHTLYVIDRRHYLGAPDDTKTDIRDGLNSDGETAINDITTELTSHNLDVISDLREGIPYREILSYIDSNAIDVVVLGTHGRTGRDRLSHLGSTTERVLKNADIPVFVINIGINEDTH